MDDEIYIVYFNGRIYDLQSIIEKFDAPSNDIKTLIKLIDNGISPKELINKSFIIDNNTENKKILDNLYIIRPIINNKNAIAYWCKYNEKLSILFKKDIMDIINENNKNDIISIHKINLKDTNKVISIDNYNFIRKKYIKQRQREGIDTAKLEGKHLGRPKLIIPDNFDDVYNMWKNDKCTAKYAMNMLGMSSSSFYRLVREKEKIKEGD